MLIHSDAGCQRQSLHCDNEAMMEAKRQRRTISFDDVSFSLLVSLMSDTYVYMKKPVRENSCGYRTVNIPENNAVLFRGDCAHAGSAYLNRSNTRLFIGIGTSKFPLSEYVSIVYNH